MIHASNLPPHHHHHQADQKLSQRGIWVLSAIPKKTNSFEYQLFLSPTVLALVLSKVWLSHSFPSSWEEVYSTLPKSVKTHPVACNQEFCGIRMKCIWDTSLILTCTVQNWILLQLQRLMPGIPEWTNKDIIALTKRSKITIILPYI